MARLRERLALNGQPSELVVHGSAASDVLLRMPGARDAIFLNLKGMSELAGWVTLWRLFRRIDPDVIFAVNQTPLIIAVLLRFLFGTRAKIVCIFHSTQMQAFERRLETPFIFAARYCDMLVYVAEHQRRHWTERGVAPRSCCVIYNGVDCPQPRPELRGQTREKLRIEEEELTLVHVAAFRDEKNHRELVDAMAMAAGRGLAVKALLVGAGPTQAGIRARVESLGLADKILFVGEQADPFSYIAASDAGVMCSRIETFPLAVLEYLNCGIPVIGSDVGGMGEIVENGQNGLLYKAGQIECFADCIGEIAHADRRAQLAANARSSVQRFSFDHMAECYQELITALSPR